MRTFLSAAALAAAMAVGDIPLSLAQSAAQHPFCALDSSSGATSCYYDSRAQCGRAASKTPAIPGRRAPWRGRATAIGCRAAEAARA